MSEVVISVRGVSKQYRIGAREIKADTFFGALRNIASAPFRNYKQIRNLTRNEVDDDTLFWALRDINFEVKQGEVMGIIGHNGAGKSTILKILSRITDPTAGEIMIKGRVSALLEVGTGFHPELTGRENVYMNGTILGMTKKEIDQKFDEIVGFSGIEKHIDTPVKFYSSGMKVRLAFAVAAHLEPELLIIDEVLAVGDAEFQKKCLGKMENIANQGRTVLFVSHNMLAVKSLCTNGLLLGNGKVLQYGDVQDVVNNYLNISNPNSEVIFDNQDSNFNNDFISLKKMTMMSKSGDGTFSIDEPLVIKISFANKNGRSNLHVNLFFNAADGTNIFVSISDGMTIPEGDVLAACEIPSNLLNDIFYSLDVMVVQDGVRPIFHAKNVMLLQGIEPPRIGPWLGKIPGIIKPKLNWNIESVN